MSTQTVYVTGIARWARVYQEDMDTAFNNERFHITVCPDAESSVMLRASGSRVKAKEDEEGTWYKFSRDNRKTFTRKGIPEEELLGPPKIIIQDGNNPDGSPKYVPFNEKIGNGSTVTVKLSVYDTKQYGKGTRLEKVLVLNHVPYEGRTNEEPF